MLTAAMVRSVKGAAASILLLLMTEPAGGNQEWLERYTNYGDKPVSQALEFLFEQGMVTRAGQRGDYVYQLAGKEKQLPLPMEKFEEGENGDDPLPGGGEEDTCTSTHTCPGSKCQGVRCKGDEGKKFEKNESELFRLEDSGGGGVFNQNPDSGGLTPPPESGGIESEKIRLELLLDRHGVRNPARKRILAGGHEFDFVQAHLVQAETMGRAIHRIEHNWPVDREKWQTWLRFYCQDCERPLESCICEWDEDEPTDDG